MTQHPKIIVHADPLHYMLVGRAVNTVTAPDYEWPSDGITMISFYTPGQEPWQGVNFSIRRNKASITIYGPSKEPQS
jgi:hypothetical protein